MAERQPVDRLKQLQILESAGVDPYPGVPPVRTNMNIDITDSFAMLEGQDVSVVGRIRSIRDHGGLLFVDLQDASGSVQLSLTEEALGTDSFDLFKKAFAEGDFIATSGLVFRTRRGQPTVNANSVTMLAKTLREIPQKLTDIETRSRQREVDLLVNPEVVNRLRFRGEMIEYMKERFRQFGCHEVETPILDTIYGGANAKPFKTTLDALSDEEFYMRISNELYLKRLMIGGLYEGVFEFSRDFRNEGMDRTHNPEFTQVELYKAYSDYIQMMDMSENLMSDIARDLLGTREVEFNGHKIDLSAPWRRLSVYDGLKQYGNIDAETVSDAELQKLAKEHGIEQTDRGWILMELFEHYAEPHLIQPTFVIDYPEITSPLTKKHRSKPGLVERFECYVGGVEVMNCYTELNDSRTQRNNFNEEMRRRIEENDDQAMPTDEGFIIAQEYGMPPMGGIGISVDRWVMIFTNAKHIRETIAFPTMKRLK